MDLEQGKQEQYKSRAPVFHEAARTRLVTLASATQTAIAACLSNRDCKCTVSSLQKLVLSTVVHVSSLLLRSSPCVTGEPSSKSNLFLVHDKNLSKSTSLNPLLLLLSYCLDIDHRRC